MTYNIHPIFVHFPIALLFIYSIIKIIPFKKWFPKVTWDYLGFILLIIGVLGAFVASSTGEIADELIQKNLLKCTQTTIFEQQKDHQMSNNPRNDYLLN